MPTLLKDSFESALRRELKEVKAKCRRAEADLEAAEKENAENADCLKQREVRIGEMSGALKSMENRMKSRASSSLVEPDERLLKVEVRLLEKKNRDLEERVKFLREVMIRDEKMAKEKLAEENSEMREKMQKLEKDAKR